MSSYLGGPYHRDPVLIPRCLILNQCEMIFIDRCLIIRWIRVVKEGCITEDFLGEFVSVFLRVDAVGSVVEFGMSKSGRFDVVSI